MYISLSTVVLQRVVVVVLVECISFKI